MEELLFSSIISEKKLLHKGKQELTAHNFQENSSDSSMKNLLRENECIVSF